MKRPCVITLQAMMRITQI